MGTKIPSKKTAFFNGPLLSSLALFLTLVLLSLALFSFQQEREDKRVLKIAEKEMLQNIYAAENAMKEMWASLQKMSNNWESSHRSPQAWEKDSLHLIQEHPGLISTFRADANLIQRQMVSTLEENKNIGLDLKALRSKNDFADARDTGLPVAGDIKEFTLVQGRGMLLTFPLRAQGKFDGLLIARVVMDAFFQDTLAPAFLKHFHVHITEQGVDVFRSDEKRTFPDDKMRSLEHPMRAATKIWNVRAEPRQIYLENLRNTKPVVILISSLLLSVLASIGMYVAHKRHLIHLPQVPSFPKKEKFFSAAKKSRILTNSTAHLFFSALIFTIMASLTLLNAYIGAQKDVTFTVQQREGLDEQRTLFKSLFLVNFLRFDLVLLRSDIPVEKEINSLISQIDHTITSLPIERYGNTVQQWASLRKKITHNLKLIDHDPLLVSFISSLRKNISQSGVESKLILDPHQESYFLANIILTRLPDNQTRLSELAFSIYTKIKNKSPTTGEDFARLENMTNMLSEIDVEQILHEISLSIESIKLSKRNQADLLRLRKVLENYAQAQKALILYIHEFSEHKSISADGFMALWLGAAKASNELWNAASLMLETLLNDRSSIETGKRNSILATGFLVSLLTALSIFFAIQWRSKADIFRQKNLLLDLALSVSKSGFWEHNITTGELRLSEGALKVFGYSKNDFSSGKEALKHIIHPDDIRATIKAALEVIRGIRKAEDFNPVSRFYYKDGRIGYTRSHAICERDHTGKALRLLGTSSDVTDIEIARKEAQEANLAKRDFLANMSHELRTPLNSIIGLNRMLFEDKTISKEHQDMVGISYRAANNLLNIINDILDLSKIEAGAIELENIVFSLQEVVDNFMEVFLPLSSQKGLTLNCDFQGDGLPYFVGDPLRLSRIMINLIGNAIKYTETGSVTISIHCQNAGQDTVIVKFLVQDTGIGIAEDKLEHIFGKFAQADASITRKFGGTGLGLSITKFLVEEMGGTIGVESKLGEGSRFNFSIPFTISAERPATDKNTFIRNTRDRLPPEKRVEALEARILVAEDHLLNQAYMQKLLPQMGFRNYEIVNNGQMAIDALTSQYFDIILMDCHMPLMSGYEATKAIREKQKETGNYTPIIAMTADAMLGTKEKCLASGMDDYISKPINSDELQHIMCRWVTFPNENEEGITTAGSIVDTKDEPSLSDFAETPEELKNLILLFIQQSEETLDTLRLNCTDGTNQPWVEAAHKLKGSAAVTKAVTLRDLCATAQQMDLASSTERRNILKKIESEYTIIKNKLLSSINDS